MIQGYMCSFFHDISDVEIQACFIHYRQDQMIYIHRLRFFFVTKHMNRTHTYMYAYVHTSCHEFCTT